MNEAQRVQCGFVPLISQRVASPTHDLGRIRCEQKPRGREFVVADSDKELDGLAHLEHPKRTAAIVKCPEKFID